MADGAIEAALALSLERVLEQMFFVTPAEGSGDETARAAALAARLDFEGQPCGSLLLRMDAEAARSIAADFLAEDTETVTPRQVEDVLFELANMICGAALSSLESGISFRLGPPRPAAATVPADFPDPAARTVDVGTGAITVFLQFLATPCPSNAKSAC